MRWYLGGAIPSFAWAQGSMVDILPFIPGYLRYSMSIDSNSVVVISPAIRIPTIGDPTGLIVLQENSEAKTRASTTTIFLLFIVALLSWFIVP